MFTVVNGDVRASLYFLSPLAGPLLFFLHISHFVVTIRAINMNRQV